MRLTAEEDAKRARELSVPGDMTPAQQNLLTVLNLRAQALTRIAEKLTAAQGRGPQAEQATNEIAGQMQMFLASDVLYSQRAAPLIVQALDEAGIKGQTIPESNSLPGYTWLAPGHGRQGDRRDRRRRDHHRRQLLPRGHLVRPRPHQHLHRRHRARRTARRPPCRRRRPSS